MITFEGNRKDERLEGNKALFLSVVKNKDKIFLPE
jgi:hypothetical protein